MSPRLLRKALACTSRLFASPVLCVHRQEEEVIDILLFMSVYMRSSSGRHTSLWLTTYIYMYTHIKQNCIGVYIYIFIYSNYVHIHHVCMSVTRDA